MALEEEGEDNDLAVLPEWVPCCYHLPHTSHASSDHEFQAGSIEDNVKKLQRRDLSVKESLATRVQIAEQKILQGTVDAIRRCFLRPMLFYLLYRVPELPEKGQTYFKLLWQCATL